MRCTPLACSILLLTLACGDDGGGAETSAGTTSTSSGTTSTSAGTTSTSSGTTESAESSGTTAAADSTGTTHGSETGSSSGSGTTQGESSSGGSMAALEASILGLFIFQDCMPIVLPDPVDVMLVLELNNVGDAPASATFVSATFVNAGGMDVGTVGLAPMVLGPVPAGESSEIAMNKVGNTLMPALGCGVVQCGQTYTLELVLDVDGQEVTASDSAMVECVF
ncbi:MAG: hypothetical protein KDK70_12130 [Myxococcales bacterium]|nr:hypothetical protein [Myxococcales bacterium]